jgi:hypothetical protein
LLTDSVAKIVIVNNAIAEVYLSKKPVSDKKANDPYSFINGNDQAFDYAINIGKFEVFDENYRAVMADLKAQGKEEIPVFNIERSNPFSLLSQLVYGC